MSEGPAAVNALPSIDHAVDRINNPGQNNKDPFVGLRMPMKVAMLALPALLPRTPSATFLDAIFVSLYFGRQLVGLSESGHCSRRVFLMFGEACKGDILLSFSVQDNGEQHPVQ